MKKTILILGIIVIFLSSCAKKIDGSSEEAMKSSIEEIKNSLDDEKKEKFEESMRLIMFHQLDFGKILQEGGTEETVSDMKSKIDGQTADEIIAEGEKIQAENERKKEEQAKIEIEELYQKIEQVEKDKVILAKFEVKRSRFYKRKKGTYYVTEEPIIELTVKNGTDKAISRAYFLGTLASPARSVPWIKDDFNYEISGGLEPGEEVTWYLAPNMFSDWGKIDAPKDAVLTIKVKKLDGPNGEELYADNFGEDDQERLSELLAAYPEYKK
ncbi:DUF6694 family lipoprotein [Labilibaculum sp.]|uniref:DUF6694 family lipoprotein n=1 Tax=Labilibaculum sp. TaxID=2060723 RepID=UPI003563190B